MPPDKTPVFRKEIIPWYNSTGAYIIVIIFMLLVFFFALTGISVAREYPQYRGYLWFPAVLLVMSATIIITATARLINRRSHKSVKQP